MVESYRNKNGSNYDCIVPVSGGKDSYYITHIVVNRLGLKPLLVNYNHQYSTPVGFRNLSNLRIKFGIDLVQKTVNPLKVKEITRATYRRFGSIYWHVIAGQTVFPVQMAVQMKIPLIIWGAHQGNDQVGMFSHHDYVEMTRKYRKDHDLMGIEAEDLINEFDNIKEETIEPFKYPSNREIERIGIRGIYLNNYIRWDSRTQHEKMIKNFGYEGRTQTRTFDAYSNPDCYLYSDLHDYLKVIKHGYAKINDHVAREIRLGHLDQQKGMELIRTYLLKKPEEIGKFLNWIGMTESGFWYIADLHRNPSFWKRNEQWEWEYIVPYPQMEVKDLYLYPDKRTFQKYQPTPEGKSTDQKEDFILLGKGYHSNYQQ